MNNKKLHPIDPFELRIQMLRYKISLQMIKEKIKRNVTRQAIHKALLGKSKPLLIEVETAIKQILKGKQ